MDFMLDVIAQGLAYSILAIGVLLTYQVLDYADLTVEGSFPLGAATGAICIVHGWNPFLAIVVAFFAGMLAGYATGFLHVKFKISSLLSGILVMTAMFSVNLIVAGDKSNIGLFTYDTIFSYGPKIAANFNNNQWIIKLWPIFILLILVLVMKLLIDWFLGTKYGFLMRITGDNPQLVATLGQDIGRIKMNGLAISNGYAAVSGAVVSQFLKFFDIQLGVGMIVLGLASVIIGLTVFKKIKFFGYTTSVIFGAITYRLAIALALNVGLPTSYLKLVMAVIFVFVLVLGNGIMGKLFHRSVKES
ncbi:MAG: ABC transporter permease [Longicatena sp.]